MKSEVRVVALLGPTAVGKTAFSLEIAQALDAEIVSVDSRLIYRSMDIGTAKPTPEQLQKVPHHLINMADPTEEWSLTRFTAAAEKAIDEITRRDRLPLLVGGTGQYLKAILQGWRPPPKPRDDRYRREYEKLAEAIGAKGLHAELARVDPVRASQIDARNVRRVIRALEIYRMTGVPPSDLARRTGPTYTSLLVGLDLPRKLLYERIDQRIEVMFQNGLVEEVQNLLGMGLDLSSPAMSAIGYRQTLAYLRGEASLEAAKREIRRQTRQFVRRQANWFKKEDPTILWFEASPARVPEIVRAIRNWKTGKAD